jgi:ferric-dicitrate binding protein FerR (iron transport regulator)
VEGSVRVSDIKANTRILKPGQESRNSKNGILSVAQVNPEDVISWTKGEFQFNDMELIHIMRQLERWYDVDVDYRQIPKTRYNAHISRSIDLEEVLKVLEVTGRIKFQIEGKTVKILPKPK